MRVTSGRFRNHRLSVPDRDVRPAADRVREAVFSMLGSWVDNQRILDLYAGTGAYGLEALSRGAKNAVFVEQDSTVIKTLRHNIVHCKLNDTEFTVKQQSVDAFLKNPFPLPPYDLICADPPYAESKSGELLQNTLQALGGESMVSSNGFLLFEQQKTSYPQEADAWELIRDRVYGRSRILLYRKKG